MLCAISFENTTKQCALDQLNRKKNVLRDLFSNKSVGSRTTTSCEWRVFTRGFYARKTFYERRCDDRHRDNGTNVEERM